jgi:hypothetical protein
MMICCEEKYYWLVCDKSDNNRVTDGKSSSTFRTTDMI